MNKLMDK